MKILLTGASGFFGSIVNRSLTEQNEIVTLSRAGCEMNVDLAHEIPDFGNRKFDVVIHAAGLAHLDPKNSDQVKSFHAVNVIGTKNLLTGLQTNPPSNLVFISSVAVYGKETGSMIKEDQPLLGKTPYAKSKIDSERIILGWGRDTNIPVLILRLPLIVGPNPVGNLGRMIQGIKDRKYLSVNSGKAQRSMVLAEDVAACIINNLGCVGTYNLTDGLHPTFRELETVICSELNIKMPPSIDKKWLLPFGILGDLLNFNAINSLTIKKMCSDLTFDSSNAEKDLNWKPRSVIKNFRISL